MTLVCTVVPDACKGTGFQAKLPAEAKSAVAPVTSVHTACGASIEYCNLTVVAKFPHLLQVILRAVSPTYHNSPPLGAVTESLLLIVRAALEASFWVASAALDTRTRQSISFSRAGRIAAPRLS